MIISFRQATRFYISKFHANMVPQYMGYGGIGYTSNGVSIIVVHCIPKTLHGKGNGINKITILCKHSCNKYSV